MVKGRRVKAVVSCARNDDCCSPHPKRRGQKLAVLQPNKTNTIIDFFEHVQVDIDIDEKRPQLGDCFEIETKQITLLHDEVVGAKNDVFSTPVMVKKAARDGIAGPPTPHRIEFCPDEERTEDRKDAAKIPKIKKKNNNQKDNHKVTDYFPVRRSVRKTKKTVMEEKQRTLEQMVRNGVEDGLEVKFFADKGRGVVTSRPFTKGDFVVEYSGDLIDINEAKRRELRYAQDKNTGCYMYYFKHNDQQYCVDATAETGKLGRLVNHSRNGNLITRTVSVDNRPRLVLIAKEDIKTGDEVTYDYGDRSKEALKHHPWLAY